MAKDSSDIPTSYDYAGQVLRIEAEKLAQRHGLDVSRVRRILQRTATDDYGRPLQPPAQGRDNLLYGLRCQPSLVEALAYLDPEDALSVFERTDPTTLSRRCRLVDYLADRASPCYTLGELADLLDAFGQHLERNRDSLIRTGYPQTGFGPSPWLEWHLTLLAPTKLPVSAFGPSPDPRILDQSAQVPTPLHQVILLDVQGLLPEDDDGNLVYSLTWSRTPIPPVRSRDGPFIVDSWEHSSPIDPCPHTEAALIDGLPADVATRLEDGRAKLFEVKRDVVAVCSHCLRSLAADALWPEVLGLLTDGLLWSEVQWHLDIEELYWRAGVGAHISPVYALRLPDGVPGTLAALLSFVGHVEKELRIGPFHRTATAIEEARAGSDLGWIESYFQVVGHSQQPAFDAALDGFRPLEQQERAFWAEFRDRVNAALETEFREEVVIRIPIKRRLAKGFEPYLRTLAEWQRAQLEATGTLSPLQLASPSEAPSPGSHVFRCDGQIWTIEYDGKPVRLPDSKGLRYLAILLSKPNQEFHVLDLAQRVGGSPVDPNRPQGRVDLEEMENLDQSGWGFGDTGVLIDEQTRADLRRRLQELPAEIEEKQEFGDADGADRLRDEQERILEYLGSAVGLGGRPRVAPSTVDQARSAVTKRINDARKRINEHHPALGRHLRTVRTGTYCQCAPDSPVDWET